MRWSRVCPPQPLPSFCLVSFQSCVCPRFLPCLFLKAAFKRNKQRASEIWLMLPSCGQKMPPDAGGDYKKSLTQTPCRHICTSPGQCGHCMRISLRSIIRGGLAGAGGCGPCSHQIKEHKSKGMRGRRSRGNCGCGYTSLTCFILL